MWELLAQSPNAEKAVLDAAALKIEGIITEMRHKLGPFPEGLDWNLPLSYS